MNYAVEIEYIYRVNTLLIGCLDLDSNEYKEFKFYLGNLYYEKVEEFKEFLKNNNCYTFKEGRMLDYLLSKNNFNSANFFLLSQKTVIDIRNQFTSRKSIYNKLPELTEEDNFSSFFKDILNGEKVGGDLKCIGLYFDIKQPYNLSTNPYDYLKVNLQIIKKIYENGLEEYKQKYTFNCYGNIVFIKDKAIVSPRVMSIRGAYINSDYLYFDLLDNRYDTKNYNVNDFVEESIKSSICKHTQFKVFESKVNNLLLDLFNNKN
jgi:hypothetical protein